ncbi:MAG: YwaF family protein [Acholeplasmatales bacterium]|jgi:hypothetical protein|nr:YwaF family protein [Acholeplasmatales bacterium]
MFTDVLSLVLMILFIILGCLYFLYSLFYIKGEKNIKYIIFHSGYSLITILFGVSLLFYYPFNSFSFLAITTYGLTAYTGFILAYYFRDEKRKKIIFYIFTGIFTFFTIWKLFSFKELTIIQRLPLNVCNILIIFMIVCSFKKIKFLDNYIICFAFLGGLANFLVGGYYDDIVRTIEEGGLGVLSEGLGFFHERFLEAALLHSLFLTMCIFTFMSNYIKLDWKKSLLNLIWIAPLFIIFSFTNQIWETDFFFTGTKGATPSFLISIYNAIPHFEITLFNFNFEINILYSLILISGCGFVLFALTYPLSKIQDRIYYKEVEQK